MNVVLFSTLQSPLEPVLAARGQELGKEVRNCQDTQAGHSGKPGKLKKTTLNSLRIFIFIFSPNYKVCLTTWVVTDDKGPAGVV